MYSQNNTSRGPGDVALCPATGMLRLEKYIEGLYRLQSKFKADMNSFARPWLKTKQNI